MINDDFKRIVKHGGCYRISIPPQIRKTLNLRVGIYMHIYTEGDKIIIEKATPDFTERKIKL